MKITFFIYLAIVNCSLCSRASETIDNNDAPGVFIFSAAEFAGSAQMFGEILVQNGLPPSSLNIYVEQDIFGIKEFSLEVIKHSLDLPKVLILFSFHGADSGGCSSCFAQEYCMQGDLCAQNSFICAQQIVDDFIVPLEGKEITLFFKSCFSGHFAQKVKELSSRITWTSATPIALVATDNNTETSTICFPYPHYSWEKTKFDHWTNLNHAELYEKMQNFSDYVNFVNSCDDFFKFTLLELNDGENIKLAGFGLKDFNLMPFKELVHRNKLRENINEKLKDIDITNLIVLIAESERSYENLRHKDMWLNAFGHRGVEAKNIHWIKDKANPAHAQVHDFFSNFDFIKPHHNVLLFIRGDDGLIEPFSLFSANTRPLEWNLVFGQKLLNAECIAEIILPKISKAHRSLVLLCSPHSDIGHEQLTSLVEQKYLNIGVVSFFDPQRRFNFSLFQGWHMGFLAPLYAGEFLYYTDGLYEEAFPKNSLLRSLSLEGFELLEKMNSFKDYIEFVQKMIMVVRPNDFAVKVYNTHKNDLKDFGFLPNIVPSSWKTW